MTQQRIMAVEVRPRNPAPVTRAVWAPPGDHSEFTFSGDGLTVERNTTHATSWRNTQSTLGRRAGSFYWETAVHYTGAADFAVGACMRAENSLIRPGDNAFSGMVAGLSVAIDRAGVVWHDNAGVASLGPVPSGAVVRHWVDGNAMTYSIAINDGPWHTIDYAATPETWPVFFWDRVWELQDKFAIVGLKRPPGTDASVTANFGGSAFAFAPPPGADSGLFRIGAAAPTPLYFSSSPFATNALETPPSQRYEARIVGDVEVARVGSCWVWGGQTEAQRGQIELINVDGALDGLAAWCWRDAPIEIHVGRVGQARQSLSLWCRAVVDHVVFDPRSQRLRLVLADALALYDTPVQTESYSQETAIASNAGRPLPITWGIPFGVTGVRLSPLTVGSNAFAWQHHDGVDPQLSGLGAIFDGGVDITDRCVRWPSSAPYRGFRVTGMAPKGKVTVNTAGAGTTTLRTVIDNAIARLDPARGTPLTVELQPGGVEGIGAWAGIYIAEPMSILEIIRRAMDSVCGWACPTRTGTALRLGRVRDPQGHTPALTLTPDNVLGSLQITLDQAKGLTTRLAGRRNYTVHSHSEIAASISDPSSPSYDAARTEALQAAWWAMCEGTAQVEGGAVLSDAYAQAQLAEHRGTLLQLDNHVQAEANRVSTLWYPTRHFIDCTALLDAVAADALEPGDVVRLQWPRFGLDAGVLLLVVAVRSRFFSRRVDLTLWGSLPREQP